MTKIGVASQSLRRYTQAVMRKSLLLLIAAALSSILLNPQTVPSSTGEVPLKPVRVSWGVVAGNATSEVMPQYPAEAKLHRVYGEVVLQLHIDKSGSVIEVKTLHGNPALATAAREALLEWKFRPYKLNGTLVELETQIACAFSPKDQKTYNDACHAEF